MNGPAPWDEVLGRMPVETLRVRRAAFDQLLSGRSITVDAVAAAAGLPAETAREAVRLIESVGMAEVEGETIVGIDGLSTLQTRHTFVLNGVALWTWCAYDIIGIASAVGGDATGTTECGLCGREISVVVRRGSPEPNPAVGWLPEESCSDVMAEFCPSALLFCSRAHLDQWRANRAGHALDVESLAERGRATWGPLISSQVE